MPSRPDHSLLPFQDKELRLWEFPSSLVFGRMDSFLHRLKTIEVSGGRDLSCAQDSHVLPAQPWGAGGACRAAGAPRRATSHRALQAQGLPQRTVMQQSRALARGVDWCQGACREH